MVIEFNNICNFRREHPGITGSGLKSNDPALIPVKNDLQLIKESLENHFANYKGSNFTIEVSLGVGNFPTILHASILPPKQKVSDGIYAVMCFDKLGRGAVVGCAESVTHPRGLKTVIRKTRKVELKIDVDGVNPTTKYNNTFENPKEFYSGIQTDSDLINHIKNSLDIALYRLGLGDSPELNINYRVAAEVLAPEFDPSNMTDGREKISRQITARRGQKKFRNALIKAYNGKCAVTGSNVESVLEAAHILPYYGQHTNHVQNGILLRSDIHLLFDLGQLTIDADSKKIKINSTLAGSYYSKYIDIVINLPEMISDHPHIDALRHHNEFEFEK